MRIAVVRQTRLVVRRFVVRHVVVVVEVRVVERVGVIFVFVVVLALNHPLARVKSLEVVIAEFVVVVVLVIVVAIALAVIVLTAFLFRFGTNSFGVFAFVQGRILL